MIHALREPALMSSSNITHPYPMSEYSHRCQRRVRTHRGGRAVDRRNANRHEALVYLVTRLLAAEAQLSSVLRPTASFLLRRGRNRGSNTRPCPLQPGSIAPNFTLVECILGGAFARISRYERNGTHDWGQKST